MPDIVSVIARRWKMMTALTLAATLLAFLACLFTTKKYLGVATALAANPVLSDKSRIFNQNIQELYTALGSPDELDRIEGTAKLDTLYLALVEEFNLVEHYQTKTNETDAIYGAAHRLRKNTHISRTGYGELRIKVWDENSQMAAALANAAMHKLNTIHTQVQTENSRLILQRLKESYTQKRQSLQNKAYGNWDKDNSEGAMAKKLTGNDSLLQSGDVVPSTVENPTIVNGQLAQYSQLINEYELALKTAPNVLLVVENARPSPYPDKPDTAQVVMLAFLASLLFSFLLALFIDSRKPAA